MNRESFLIERYKYVLEQKRTLNEKTFKIVSLFQVVIAAIAAGNYEVIKSTQGGEISSATAILAIHILYGGFLIATIACLSLLVGGIVSWLDYRTDESRIEAYVHGNPKSKIKLTAPLRWYETYIALTMLASIVGYSLVLPLLSKQCEQTAGKKSPTLLHDPKLATKN